MVGYQILVVGQLAIFDGSYKHYSKNIYITHPSPEEVLGFIERCCTEQFEGDMCYLKKDTTSCKVVEVNIIKGEG